LTVLPVTDEAAVPASSQRASFDCEAPSSTLEILICADAELGQTDIELAQAYDDAGTVMAGAQHKDLIESERQWLRFVSGKCPLGAVGGIPSVLCAIADVSAEGNARANTLLE
jgi:uncharacterized protein YecT (DUF1311 family)